MKVSTSLRGISTRPNFVHRLRLPRSICRLTDLVLIRRMLAASVMVYGEFTNKFSFAGLPVFRLGPAIVSSCAAIGILVKQNHLSCHNDTLPSYWLFTCETLCRSKILASRKYVASIGFMRSRSSSVLGFRRTITFAGTCGILTAPSRW